MEMASGWLNMGRILRLGFISIMLVCVFAGSVSASVTLSGPATVTRGGVSDGEPNVDGYFNLTAVANQTASAPMYLGLVIRPQTMTGNICDRPPYFVDLARQDFILGEDTLVWPTDDNNRYSFKQVSPNGDEDPSAGCWVVPWDGTHYYGLINSINATVQVGTLYPDDGTNEFLSTSTKPGTYQYHLQSEMHSVPGVDAVDLNVTIVNGEVTIAAYDFEEWSKGNLVPVSSIPAGHTVILQGINTDSQNTHLYLGGDTLPECGIELANLSVTNGGAFINGTWFYQFVAPCVGSTFEIYASSVDPADVVSRLCYSEGGCSLQCSEGRICGLFDCPTCGVYGKTQIEVTQPDFNFEITGVIDRCCCEAYPCGQADVITSMNLTGQTGVPNVPVQVWLFGDSWISEEPYLVGMYRSGLDEKGSFSLDLRTLLSEKDINLCDLATGQYHVIVQIPGCGLTDFSVGTEYIPTQYVGYDAYNTLITKLQDVQPSECLLCPPSTDEYVDLEFSIRDVCGDGSADFTATPREGFAPETIQFTDTSTFKGTVYSWDFGDNFSSTEQNPVHEYVKPGIYDVYLKITNETSGAWDDIQKRAYITIADPEAKYGLPQAAFTYSPRTADPMTLQFIDQSYGATNLTYLWDFGDGSSSTEKVPAHTYGAAGTFTVTLTVTDFYEKTSTVSKAIEVPAKPSGLPEISFTADQITGPYPLPVQFQDKTTTTWADSWQWDFGDGATSSLRSPMHTYTTPGKYAVTLRASNVNGEGSEATIPDYITVQHSAPVITATADPMSGLIPLRVEFTATATVDNKSVGESAALIKDWLWDFGDDSTSHEQNPVHVYEKPGSNHVLVVCTLHDDQSSMFDLGTIEVGPVPYADFYWEYLDKDETCCYLVKFTDTSYGAASWLWDFGDGMTSEEQNPTHRYKEVGFYNVTLTVDDGTGKTDLKPQTIQITSGYTTPTPTPTPTPVPGAVEAQFYSTAIGTRTIQFTDQSTGSPVTWMWDFGDDTESQEQNPTHIYPKDGEYTVTLTAANTLFSDAVSQTIGVR